MRWPSTYFFDSLVEYIQRINPRKMEAEWGEDPEREPQYSRSMANAAGAVLLLGELGDKSVLPFLESLRGIKDLKLERIADVVGTAIEKIRKREKEDIPVQPQQG